MNKNIANMQLTEYQITCNVADYLRKNQIDFIHIPNEGKRSVQTATMLKRMGMSAGFPDMMIFRSRSGYHALVIELKRRKGSKVSPAQKIWIDTLNKCGFAACVCFGDSMAMDCIDHYLEGSYDEWLKDVCSQKK